METMYLGYVKKERRRANETSYYPRRKEKMLRTIISVIITWSNIPVILTRPIDWDVKEGMEEEKEEEEEEEKEVLAMVAKRVGSGGGGAAAAGYRKVVAEHSGGGGC